jgi:hypothetical protein
LKLFKNEKDPRRRRREKFLNILMSFVKKICQILKIWTLKKGQIFKKIKQMSNAKLRIYYGKFEKIRNT